MNNGRRLLAWLGLSLIWLGCATHHPTAPVLKAPAHAFYIIPPDGGGGGGGNPHNCGFPTNNLYYASISALSVHDSSALWVATVTVTSPRCKSGANDSGFVHVNLGSANGHYVNHTGGAYQNMHVTGPGTDAASYPANGGWELYPYTVHQTFLQQGDPDQHCIMADTLHCLLYETYRTSYDGTSKGQPNYADSNACWDGVKWDESTNALHDLDCSTADEAGLPLAVALFTYQEVCVDHSIPHAIRCQSYGANILAGSAGTSIGTIWPARHSSHGGGGYTIKSHALPMGARIRLSSAFTPTTAESNDAAFMALTTCLKTYGAIVSDRGDYELALSGVADTRWDQSWLSANFNATTGYSHDWLPYLQVVNESGHMSSAGSMQWVP